MSMSVDMGVDVGAIAAGVGIGAAAAIAGPAALAIVGGAVAAVAGTAVAAAGVATAAGAVASVFSLAKGTFDSLKEIKEYTQAEKEAVKEAEALIESLAEASEEKAAEFASRYRDGLSLCVIGLTKSDLAVIEAASAKDRLKAYTLLSSCLYNVSELQELFYEFTKEGMPCEYESTLYEILDNLKLAVKEGNVEAIEKAKSDLTSLASSCQTWATEKCATGKFQKIERLLYEIKYEIGSPVLILFQNELAEAMSKTHENSIEAGYEEKLKKLADEAVALYERIGDLELADAEKLYGSALLTFIAEEIKRDDISFEAKYEECSVRLEAMKATYERLIRKYPELEEKKKQYDTLFLSLFGMSETLKLAIPEYAFHPETADEDIALISQRVEAILPEYLAKKKEEIIEKAVRETMREVRYSFVEESEAVFPNGKHVKKLVFLIDEGNVLLVQIVDGELIMTVNGVKLDGFKETKQDSMRRSAKHVCSKLKLIVELLKSKGLSIDINELIDASENVEFEEIELSEGAVGKPLVIKSRREAEKKKEQEEQKRRYLND